MCARSNSWVVWWWCKVNFVINPTNFRLIWGWGELLLSFCCYNTYNWLYKSGSLNFAFRKLELNTIYKARLNKLLFKYYISILGGGGLRPNVLCLFSGERGPEFRKPCLYDTWMLLYVHATVETEFYHKSTKPS